MTDFRKFPRSGRRSLVDYNKWVVDSSEYVVLCVNKAVINTARIMLSSRGFWPTTYVSQYSQGGYYPIDDQQLELVKGKISEFLESTTEMNCNDFLDALTAIGANIQELSQSQSGLCCGEGSGGRSPTEPPETFVDDGTNPPDGFTDYSSYDSHKCNTAQWFVNTWKQDVEWLKTVDIVALGVAGVGASILIPGINVVGLVGVLLLIVTLGLFTSELQTISDWITDNENDIRCRVYNASSADTALSSVVTLIESSSLTGQQQTIALYWVTQAAMNKAFSNENIPDLLADCSNCSANFEILSGVLSSGNLDMSPGTFQVQSVPDSTFAGDCPDNLEYVAVKAVGGSYRIRITTDQSTNMACNSSPPWTFRIAQTCASGQVREALYTSFQNVEYCLEDGYSFQIRADVGDSFTATIEKLGV